MFGILAATKPAPGSWSADHYMADYWPDTSMLAGEFTCTKQVE